jgi:hypothetical protein
MKTKLFFIQDRNNSDQINDWLEDNPNITVLFTNTFANDAGWGYMILYKILD